MSPFLSSPPPSLSNSSLLSSSPSPICGIEFHCHPKRVFRVQIRSRSGNRPIGIRCEGRDDDGFYMRRCVELAKTAVGFTSPNPMVGCVIVKGGEIVGEGFHPKAGQPHAEVFALKDAGTLAENATAYVSLEPCDHYGRTPPCTEALIRARVKRVVVGMVDPNPIVASKGVERLRRSGIDVTVGVEELLCRKLNEAYIHRMITGKPFVALRYSLSFNGKILNKLGRGAEEPSGYYSKLLREYDGVVISGNSSERASSLPRSREPRANQPLQIIVARGENHLLRLPSLTADHPSTKIVVLGENTVTVEPSLEGIETVILEQLNLRSILDFCAGRGLCSVLLDLDGDSDWFRELIDDGVHDRLVQKVVMELRPDWDSNDEISSLSHLKQDLERDSLRLVNLRSMALDEGILVEGYMS